MPRRGKRTTSKLRKKHRPELLKHQYDHAVHSAMGLFQEEPDEPDGPALFQAENDRVDWFPLQDEGDEPDDRFLPSQPSQPSSTPQPFQDEDDEADCDSDSSGCLADGEVDVNKDKYQELVQLNFATLTKFLESQLSPNFSNSFYRTTCSRKDVTTTGVGLQRQLHRNN